MYSQVFQTQANIFKALAEPKRLEIIHLLRGQRLNVSAIITMLGLTQANASQHLMVMREAGLVITHRVGKEIYYSLKHKNILKACDALRDFLIEQFKGDPLATELTQKMSDLAPLVKDPICGMRLSPKTAGFAYKLNGETYYFCASGCLKKFKTQKRKL